MFVIYSEVLHFYGMFAKFLVCFKNEIFMFVKTPVFIFNFEYTSFLREHDKLHIQNKSILLMKWNFFIKIYIPNIVGICQRALNSCRCQYWFSIAIWTC